MIRYRIKQYPENTFIVQYKASWLAAWWSNINQFSAGTNMGAKKFANLKQAEHEVKIQREDDVRWAFKPVYYKV